MMALQRRKHKRRGASPSRARQRSALFLGGGVLSGAKLAASMELPFGSTPTRTESEGAASLSSVCLCSFVAPSSRSSPAPPTTPPPINATLVARSPTSSSKASPMLPMYCAWPRDAKHSASTASSSSASLSTAATPAHASRTAARQSRSLDAPLHQFRMARVRVARRRRGAGDGTKACAARHSTRSRLVILMSFVFTPSAASLMLAPMDLSML